MAKRLKKTNIGSTYIPPDFQLFEKLGYGLLEIARRAITDLVLAENKMYGVRLEDYPTWKSIGGHNDDLISVYGYWAKADDMISRLNSMDLNEQTKHIKLDSRKFPHEPSFEQAKNEFEQLTAEITAWEIAHHDIVYTTLNRQLQDRLDSWEEYLRKIEKDPTIFEDPYPGQDLDCIGCYCAERTLLEQARVGITRLRMIGFSEPVGFERLEPLPYFETYEKRLEELDIRFKKIAHGQHCIVLWADPTFWWHQPELEQQ